MATGTPRPPEPYSSGSSSISTPTASPGLLPASSTSSVPQDARSNRSPPPPQHQDNEPAQHRRTLRPRKRFLQALARPHHDLFLREVHRRRTDPRVTPSTPNTRRSAEKLQPPPGRPRPRDRLRLGRLRSSPPPAYGCRVTGVTISPAQYDEATRRVAQAGLKDRIDHPPPGLPRHHRALRQDRLHRNARSRRRPLSSKPTSPNATRSSPRTASSPSR